MSEERCQICGSILGPDNLSCPSCGLVRNPTSPPEVEAPPEPVDFEVPNFGPRASRAILPHPRTRQIHLIFLSIWGGTGTTLIYVSEGKVDFITAFVAGLGMAICSLAIIGGILGDGPDDEVEETVGDVLDERLREARKRTGKKGKNEVSGTSTGITAEEPPPLKENIERPSGD